ncbi:MAG: type 4a pilus biogenesis protein PilO [Phycisphaerae bacterium]
MQLGPRTLVFVLLLMALPVASYFLMFKPREEQMRAAIAEATAKQEKLRKLEDAKVHYRDLAKATDTLRQVTKLYEGKLPDEKETDKVLNDIWKQARTSGLNVKSVRYGVASVGNGYSQQTIRVVIDGSFTGFHEFLRSLEGGKRIIRIGEMTIEKDPKVDGNVITDLQMTIFFERSGFKEAA